MKYWKDSFHGCSTGNGHKLTNLQFGKLSQVGHKDKSINKGTDNLLSIPRYFLQTRVLVHGYTSVSGQNDLALPKTLTDMYFIHKKHHLTLQSEIIRFGVMSRYQEKCPPDFPVIVYNDFCQDQSNSSVSRPQSPCHFLAQDEPRSGLFSLDV